MCFVLLFFWYVVKGSHCFVELCGPYYMLMCWNWTQISILVNHNLHLHCPVNNDSCYWYTESNEVSQLWALILCNFSKTDATHKHTHTRTKRKWWYQSLAIFLLIENKSKRRRIHRDENTVSEWGTDRKRRSKTVRKRWWGLMMVAYKRDWRKKAASDFKFLCPFKLFGSNAWHSCVTIFKRRF